MPEDDRIKRAAKWLRELEASGVEPSEILGGEAGAQFVRDYCSGDPDLASAAFALVHSPAGREVQKEKRSQE
jgi:hypothetical protein